jgi:glycerophosphoryl diester phosphodiesterase
VSWPGPRIVAHRGGGSLAPENTLGAIRLGASLGFKGVEFDVMLAGCTTPVLIHDETLERTTNGRGAVSATLYSTLATLNAGNGEPVPSFEQAARLCRELGLWANVEIKPAKGYERATGEAVAKTAAELWRGADVPPLLSSFSSKALAQARDVSPALPRGFLVDRIRPDWKARLGELQCVALHCNYKHLSREMAAQVRAAGYALLVYTVNEPADAQRLLGWGVDCIVTDALDRISPNLTQES